MKRAFLTAFSLAMASTALAQVPVIDSANLKIATETSDDRSDPGYEQGGSEDGRRDA